MNLKIVIEAILKGQGIQATAQQVDQLASSIEKAAEGGKPLETSTEAIVEQYKALGTETAKAATVTDEMKKEAQDAAFWLQFYSRNGGDAADASRRLGQQVNELSKAAGGAKQVMDGLSVGGIGGLITAARGALSAVRALATSGFGLALLPVLGVASAALIALNRSFRSNQEQMKKWAEESAAASEAYKERAAAAMQEVNAVVREQAAALAALNAEFGELLGRIEGASKRNQTLSSAQRSAEDAALAAEEQQALAAATSPDERTDIQRRFSRRRTDLGFAREQQDLTNTDLAATVRERAAREAIAQARAERDQSAATLRDAEARASEAEDRARRDFAADPTSADTRRSQGEARALRDALEPLRAELAKRNETIARAQAELDGVALTREELPYRQSALASRREAELTSRATEDRQLEIQRREAARARELQDRADIGGAAVEDLGQRALQGDAGQQPSLRPLIEQVIAASKEIQGEASAEELTAAVNAIREFVAATQDKDGATRQQLIQLGRELNGLRQRVDAIRVTN